MRVNVCRDCYHAIERAPLLHVRRILRACPTCRELVKVFARPNVQKVFDASVVADALQRMQPRQRRGRL